MKKILFSPIGMTDPITHLKDGSMLHICRVYKPNIIILYMSAEVIAFHEKDNRYVYCLEELAKKMEHPIEIHIIRRPNLINVQEYDTFYDDFYKIIGTILQKIDKNDELIVNVSSGTPAMKSALLVLSVLFEYKMRAVQVTTPTRKSNTRLEDKVNYDVQTNWMLNEDNESDFENRCSEPRTHNFSVLIMKDNIRKLVASYDYEAALAIANEIKDHVSETARGLLRIGSERLKLNRNMIDKIAKKISYDIIPIKQTKTRFILEYALALDIKRIKGEYADFVRALTPLTADLVENILREQCHIDIDDYSDKDGKGVRRFSRSKLANTQVLQILENDFHGDFIPGLVGKRQMVPLIQFYSTDEELKKQLTNILNIEQNVRNLSAHEIVSVTPKWIKEKSGYEVEEIFSIIKFLIGKSGIVVNEEIWKSYDIMNQYIYEELDK